MIIIILNNDNIKNNSNTLFNGAGNILTNTDDSVVYINGLVP